MNRPALSRRRFLRTAGEAVGAVGVASLGNALLPALTARAAEITTTDLGGLFLLDGAGANVLAMPGEDGALMIDGGLAENAEALLGAVFAATGNERVHTLINTHWHPEQTGANELVGRAGGVIFAQEKTAMYLSSQVYSGKYERIPPLPEAARPNETTRGEGTLEFAGRRLDHGYLPAAHTDGDLFRS
jgi:cyclase